MSTQDGPYTCPRCGHLRLPAWWYKPGYEWMGHPMACIGVSPAIANGEK